MTMRNRFVWIKLGGSLITDKRVEKSFRRHTMMRLADEVARARGELPNATLLIGHGSGSFGHFAAKRADTIHGVQTPDEWHAFAAVSRVAAELNQLVCDCLAEVGLPAMRFSPSASATSCNGVLTGLHWQTIEKALDAGLLPVIHGDVALDNALGGTIISTESVFIYLAQHLQVDEIILLGEVDGVLGPDGRVVPSITPKNLKTLEDALGGSDGVDVTGGMETKVRDMLKLIDRHPNLQVRIANGAQEKLLYQLLTGRQTFGTVISA